MYKELCIKDEVINMAKEIDEDLKPVFKKIEENCLFNSQKVLKAFQDNKVSTVDFNEVTGYGFYDMGREKLEKVYAQIFRSRGRISKTTNYGWNSCFSYNIFWTFKIW